MSEGEQATMTPPQTEAERDAELMRQAIAADQRGTWASNPYPGTD